MARKAMKDTRRRSHGKLRKKDLTIRMNMEVCQSSHTARLEIFNTFDYNLGHDEEEGGHKKSHYDEADSHKEHHESGKKQKGGKHGHKKFHKKGSKTTGYHKKANKDEYHKEHKFYDDKHEEGKHKVSLINSGVICCAIIQAFFIFFIEIRRPPRTSS